MKKQTILALTLMLSLVLGSVALATSVPGYWPATGTEGIEPTVIAKIPGGAGEECTAVGYDFGWKVDAAAPNGTYDSRTDQYGNTPIDDMYANVISISNSDGVFFDWEVDAHPLGAVLVKAATLINVFDYDAAYLDTDVYSVVKDAAVYDEYGNMIEDPTFYDVSHVTFCWNEYEGGEVCYQDETAWAVGDPYNTKGGNWAMYVPYYGEELTVDIRADGGDGVGIHAGTATFSAPDNGNVTITINLDNSFIFYYDLNDDLEDNNLKVQDYDSAPHGNPKIGKFDWKTMIEVGETTGSITVPENSFYGVHLDLAYEVPCQ